MCVFLLLILFYVANGAPVTKDVNDEGNIGTSRENEVIGQPKAGIVDTLNPFNNHASTSEKSKDNEQNNNPLGGIQNLFNTSNNPLTQLFSSNSGDGNFLNDIKIFLVGSQGMVLPASAILGGMQNFMQAIGNMGNFIQGAQNFIPSIPQS